MVKKLGTKINHFQLKLTLVRYVILVTGNLNDRASHFRGFSKKLGFFDEHVERLFRDSAQWLEF